MPHRKRVDNRPGIGRVNASIDAIIRTTKAGATPAHATQAHAKSIAQIEGFEAHYGAHSATR